MGSDRRSTIVQKLGLSEIYFFPGSGRFNITLAASRVIEPLFSAKNKKKSKKLKKKKMSRRSIKYATKGGKKDKSYSVSQMTRGRFSAPRSSTTMQAMRTGGWASPSGPELKYIDTNANTAITFASSAFATGILSNGVAQGSDATARIEGRW